MTIYKFTNFNGWVTYVYASSYQKAIDTFSEHMDNTDEVASIEVMPEFEDRLLVQKD